MAETHTVAVYGSLLSGLHNHQRFLAGADYLGDGWTEPGYTLYDLGAYPGAVADGGRGRVRVAVYRVDGATLDALDALEGNGRYYFRRRSGIRLDAGAGIRHVTAWMYLLPAATVAGAPVVPDGDWRAYRARRAAGTTAR